MLFKSLVSKLKIASATVLGGIKVGNNLTIESDGKLNAVSTDVSMKADKVPISPSPAGYVATFDSTGNLVASDRQVATDIPPDPTAVNDFIVATANYGYASEIGFDGAIGGTITDTNGQTVTKYASGGNTVDMDGNGNGVFNLVTIGGGPVECYISEPVTTDTDLLNKDFEITYTDFKLSNMTSPEFSMIFFGNLATITGYAINWSSNILGLLKVTGGIPSDSKTFSVAGYDFTQPHTVIVSRVSGIVSLSIDGNTLSGTNSGIDNATFDSYAGSGEILLGTPYQYGHSFVLTIGNFSMSVAGVGSSTISWEKKTLTETGAILEGDIEHNNIQGKQGGSLSASEYYHLTSTEHDNVERYSPLFDNMLVGRDTEILSDTNYSWWNVINNNGEAVGVDNNDNSTIYRDSYGTITNLGYLGIPSATVISCTGLNDSGIIVGYYQTGDYVSKGFYKLPNEDAITVSLAYVSSVNNNGVAVGCDSSNNLCTYDPINGVTNLGKFGYTSVFGWSINDNGDICGNVIDGDISKWFIRLSNDPDNLIVDAVDYDSSFYGINNNGDAVGYCTVSGDWTPLLRKSDGTIVKLDIPEEFIGNSGSDFCNINNNGDAVGYFIDNSWEIKSIGFIRLSDGTIVYLDQLNVLVCPYSINDSREIVGEATSSDWEEEYAFYIPPLTTFIPDASTTKRGLVKVGDGLTIGEYNTLTVDTSAVSHNSLSGLDGGSASPEEYYHLDFADYTALTAATTQLQELQTDGNPEFAIVKSKLGEVYKTASADSPLTALQCKRTIVSNYGMTDADCAITLPAAEEGLAFLCILPTVRARYFRLTAYTGDKIYLSGTAGSAAGYVGVASGYATGTACQMFTFKASDGGFDWFCLPIFGTWVAG